MLIEQTEKEIGDLLLDPQNPRLPSYLDRTPTEIFRFLALSSSIDELVAAIGSNGFFLSEPIIGVPSEGKVVVVEGNRRLTALKLLTGEIFEDIPKRLIDVVEQAEHRPDRVPVAIYENRGDVLNYLGNKHIAGVKPWGALAKARYAKQLFETTRTDGDFSSRVRAVAKMIGSRTDFIGRALKALEAYEYAADRSFFNLADVDEQSVKFSLLSTALDYEGVQDFVYDDPKQDLYDRQLQDEPLKEMFVWMFQRRDNGSTALGESRNLNKLSKVVANEEGLRKFRQGLTLDQAYKLTDGIDDEFDQITGSIQSGLKEANSLVADVSYNEERDNTVKSIARQARVLKNALDEANED